MSADGLKFLLWRNLNLGFLLASMKALTTETLMFRLSDTRLYMVLTNVPKAGFARVWKLFWKPPKTCKFSRIFPTSTKGKHQRKSIRKASRNKNFHAAFGKIFRISKYLHRWKLNLYIYFSLHQWSLKSKKKLSALIET